MAKYMRREEVDAYRPDRPPDRGQDPLQLARRRIEAGGCQGTRQQMGNHWAIGCVALEITQRCNLDCTLCYLSDHSEAVQDLPMDEIFRRIDLIYHHYGKNTDVQITGGEPTLRRPAELLAIVARIHRLGMRSTLMTNGARLKRAQLEALVEAGLVDIAFHVDTTQQRKGFSNEADLNRLRETYIQRARGLPVCVLFNTTIHTGNLEEVPLLVRFFSANADVVTMASFQLQADTGRGVAGSRDSDLTQRSLETQIRKGAGTAVDFDASLIGHPECNRYAACLSVNGKLYNAIDNSRFFQQLQSAASSVSWDRAHPLRAARQCLAWLLRHPRYIFTGIHWAALKFWEIKRDLLAGKGRVHRLALLTHNFMDACHLQRERIDACVFKVMTRDGPLSMCLHNAKRDEYILQPVKLESRGGCGYWQPLSGAISANEECSTRPHPDTHPLKKLKGRSRARRLNAVGELSCETCRGVPP